MSLFVDCYTFSFEIKAFQVGTLLLVVTVCVTIKDGIEIPIGLLVAKCKNVNK